MPDGPLISVCVPVYNRQEFIKDALESVLQQTYRHFEIIVIDDGSTDQSIDLVKSINDSRISIYENGENKGVVYSRNRYLTEAGGEFIAMLDSDDIWNEEKLKKQVRFLTTNPDFGICGTWGVRRQSEKRDTLWSMAETDEEIRVQMLWSCPIIHSSLMIRRSILDRYDIRYDQAYANSEDYELLRRLLRHTKAYCLPDPLVVYNLHPQQLSSQKNSFQLRNAERILENYFRDLGIELTPEQRKLFLKVYSFRFRFSLDNLKKIKKLFLQMLSDCEDNLPSLKPSLSMHFFLSCYHSSHLGLKTATFYRSSHKALPYRPSLYEWAKFYLKCAFKL